MLLHSIFSFLRPHPRLGEINEYSSSTEVRGQLGAEDQLGDFWHGVRPHSRKAIVKEREAGGRRQEAEAEVAVLCSPLVALFLQPLAQA